MPHLVLAGSSDLADLVPEPGVHRWGRAVLKIGDGWLRVDHQALLVEGVVVEFARPQHPVALIAEQRGDIVVRLWPVVGVERTEPVQRWLCTVAAALQRLGAGPVKVTNIPRELWRDLNLVVVDDPATDG
jgi:hypothetical protein